MVGTSNESVPERDIDMALLIFPQDPKGIDLTTARQGTATSAVQSSWTLRFRSSGDLHGKKGQLGCIENGGSMGFYGTYPQLNAYITMEHHLFCRENSLFL